MYFKFFVIIYRLRDCFEWVICVLKVKIWVLLVKLKICYIIWCYGKECKGWNCGENRGNVLL